jgi:hypothetical protein
MNHVAGENEKDVIHVNVDSLDNILNDHQIPQLLKIDVEGFETEVVNGAHSTLQNSSVKAIIIELPGDGARYGYDENQLHDKLISFGFNPFQYDPFKRELLPIEKFGSNNTLYARDKDFILNRVQSAPKINSGNIVF